MGLIDTIKRLSASSPGAVINYGPVVPAQRAISMADFMSDDYPGGYARAGVSITRENSVRISAVYACARVLTNAIATLPVDVFVKYGATREPLRPRPAWLDAPQPGNPNYTRIVHMTQVVWSLLFAGDAYVLATPDVFNPVELTVLDPRKIEPKMVDGRVVYKVFGEYGRETGTLSPFQLLHIPLFPVPGALHGQSPIDLAREGLGLAAAAEKFGANWFGKSGVPQVTLRVPKDVPYTDQQADRLRQQWTQKNGPDSTGPAVLTGGIEVQTIAVNPEDAQWLELRKFQVEDIARIFGVPPHLIGVTEPGAASYASVEMQQIEFVTHTVRPLVELIEAGYQRLVPGDQRTFLKFNLSGLLRGDAASRAAYYSQMFNVGAMSPDDIRAKEDLPPVDGGDVYRVPLALADSTTSVLRQKADTAKVLVDVGYTPQEAAAAVGLVEPAEKEVPPQLVKQDDQKEDDDEKKTKGSRAQEVLLTIPSPRVTVAQPPPDMAPVEAVLRELKQSIDMAPVAEAITDIKTAMAARSKSLSTKKVIRDSAGRIVEVDEERDGVTVRQMVNRDDKGVIVSVEEMTS